eukprot:Pgem_evm1s1673
MTSEKNQNPPAVKATEADENLPTFIEQLKPILPISPFKTGTGAFKDGVDRVENSSIYFDSDNMFCYEQRTLKADRADLFRTRYYGTEPSRDSHFLERKRHRNTPNSGKESNKKRALMASIEADKDFKTLSKFQAHMQLLDLKPKVKTEYFRTSFMSKEMKNVRITLDEQIKVSDPNIKGKAAMYEFPFAVIEVKISFDSANNNDEDKRIPEWLTMMFLENNAQKLKFSKFNSGAFILYPELCGVDGLVPIYQSKLECWMEENGLEIQQFTVNTMAPRGAELKRMEYAETNNNRNSELQIHNEQYADISKKKKELNVHLESNDGAPFDTCLEIGTKSESSSTSTSLDSVCAYNLPSSTSVASFNDLNHPLDKRELTTRLRKKDVECKSVQPKKDKKLKVSNWNIFANALGNRKEYDVKSLMAAERTFTNYLQLAMGISFFALCCLQIPDLKIDLRYIVTATVLWCYCMAIYAFIIYHFRRNHLIGILEKYNILVPLYFNEWMGTAIITLAYFIISAVFLIFSWVGGDLALH